jgi:signal transduction histidine kinase
VRKAAGIDGADVAAGPIAEVVAPLDAPRITQALLQLAQNAVTHGGGRFMIGSHVDTGELRLWVRDYGSGVADADKQDVFERFTRASAEAPGSGLGLNIVQVIARAHGGSATVADAAGGSAIFQISIPLTERSISGVDPHRR